MPLNKVLHLLDFRKGTEKERLYKKAFFAFFRWILRKRYAIYVLKNDKIRIIKETNHKITYLQSKNKLLYLPDLK